MRKSFDTNFTTAGRLAAAVLLEMQQRAERRAQCHFFVHRHLGAALVHRADAHRLDAESWALVRELGACHQFVRGRPTPRQHAAAARHDDVRIPASNVKRAVAEVLRQEGFVKNVTEAEEGLPVRPLAGSMLVAQADQPTDQPTPEVQARWETQPEQKPQPDTFERLLNGLFGGT